jgi:chaperone required for assembly of F1-ATPase
MNDLGMNNLGGDNKPKRFWKAATIGPRRDGGWPVLLDGRQARTPQRAPLLLPTEPLAALIAREWDASGEIFDFAGRPATRLANTAIDRVGGAREAVAEEIVRYASADALCYFAAAPKSLVERQVERWGPVLDWAETDLGLTFDRATGVGHVTQPEKTLTRVRALALSLDDFALAGLAWAAALYGSAVLALALLKRELDGETAFDLSRLDEIFQVEQWGEDAEAAARVEARRAEAKSLELWFAALVTS